MGNLCAQGQQERWKRPGCCPVVRLAEERHSPPGDDTAHLEVRKRDIGDRFEEDSLIGVRDEVFAIVEPRGQSRSKRFRDVTMFQSFTACHVGQLEAAMARTRREARATDLNQP